MTGYLGYESNDKGEKKTENRQGGFSPKTIKTSMGELEISVPRDRNASVGDFAVSATFPQSKAKRCTGMSTHDIEATIDDIYGFKLSAEQISKITDFTPFWLRYERKKRYFGLVDSGHRVQTFWMQIFDAAFRKSVLCVWTKGFEDGARAIFPNVVVQRCIVHLIRNSLKYVPTKDYKAFCNDLKKIYGAPSKKAAQTEFEPFCQV